MSMTMRQPGGLRGVHVFWAVAAFFATVIAVNAGFIYFAVRTFPGEDVKRSYLQGLHYNDTLAARRAQAALGWSATVGFEPAGARTRIAVDIVDRNGEGVEHLTLEGELRRPLDSRLDRTLTFVERGAGRYEADIDAPFDGLWDVRAAAVRGDDRFALERRLQWPLSTPR